MPHSWLLIVLWILTAPAFAKETGGTELAVGQKFLATDTLSCGEESSTDARQCIADLSWEGTDFSVEIEGAEAGCGDWLVRFPSARPVGNATNDFVSMEWFAARDKNGEIRAAPAIVVVHESGSRMTVGRLIARGLSSHGLNAFLLHLPGYGPRRVAGVSDIERTLPALQQAIADVRRARDAVAPLPGVDDSVVGLQGTSLGGFVAATTAGLDRGYDRVFILLAGGNVHEVVLKGARDAAKVREKLFAAGVTEQQIKDMSRKVEPLRLAHRLNPKQTWVYSAQFDDVVLPENTRALVEAAKLPKEHHIELPADHYSGAIYLPKVMQQISQHMIETSAE
jgi:dienelactone hydrolase